MNAVTPHETLVEIVQRAQSLADAGSSDAAIEAYRAWLAVNDAPAAFAVYFNLSVLYFNQGLTGLAQAALRDCLRCNPEFETAKRLCKEPTMDQRRPMAARASYGHTRLKVGWLGHGAAFFTPQVQSALAEVSASPLEHVMWAWGSDRPMGAIDVSALSDEALACAIRASQVDVLVDLMGWNEHSRPGVVAYHPAPTVVAWTENPQPSGLRAVDAVIAAHHALPLHAPSRFTEALLFLSSHGAGPGHNGPVRLSDIESLLLQWDQSLPARAHLPVPDPAELAYLAAPRERGRRYIIVAPPYQHASAGIRVLYDLQKWLVLAGYDALVCTWFPGYPVDSFSEDIVVYPEVAPGNLLQAKRVVRFILNTPGKLGHGEKTYAPGELLVAYNHELAPYADGLVLQVPTTEPFFFDGGGQRDKDAMYVGKGRNLGLHLPECVEITKLYPPTRRQLADLLRTVRTLYTYDDFTILAHEARLCGCNVTLIDASGTKRPMQTTPMPSVAEFRAQLHHFIQITQNLSYG